MATSVDGNTIERVFVDSTAVTRVKVDGSQAWPLAYTEMTAEHQVSLDEYGYLRGSYGSIAEDTTVKGSNIDSIRWANGSNSLFFNIDGTHSQSFYTLAVLETDQGIQKFYTSAADSFQNSGGVSIWQYDLATNPFTDTQVYRCWFV